MVWIFGRIFSFLRLDIVDRLHRWDLGVWDGTQGGVLSFLHLEELVAPKCENLNHSRIAPSGKKPIVEYQKWNRSFYT